MYPDADSKNTAREARAPQTPQKLKIFKEKHIVRVPVTENGKLVGILSRIDALKGILEEPEFMLF